MLSRIARVAVSCAVFGEMLAGSALPSRADDRAASPRVANKDTRRPITLTVNPLAFAIQRYGVNLEVSPAPHHAIVGSAYYQSIPVWAVRTVVGSDRIDGGGGGGAGVELGYRLYSERSGADGVFAGASFLSMPLAYPRIAADLASIELSHFSAMGAAIDIGAQKVFDGGFTVGVGAGVMLLAYDLPEDSRRVPTTFVPHVLPRVLVSTGWSF